MPSQPTQSGHKSLWRIPFFVALMLAARGLPMITSIATREGRTRPVNAAALVAAGMVIVMVFPAVGIWRMRRVGAVSGRRDSRR